MKKYKFVGDPDEYNNTYCQFVLSKNEILEGTTTPSGWFNSVEHYAFSYPEDWELVKYGSKDNLFLTNHLADELLSKRIEMIKSSLLIKAKEYSKNGDRMHNFNKASEITGKIREECLADFRLKQEISASDIREDIKINKLPSEELVIEKYGDIINYYILEEMSILQRIRNENSK